MAQSLGDFQVRLGADIRGLITGFKQAGGTMRSFAATAGRVLGPIVALTIGAGGMIALVGALRSVIRVGAEFEQTMATVGGVMRATADEQERLTKIARKMGETTEWSATQAAEALQFLGMAGFTANKAIKALPGTLDLATAGQIDLGRAADIATNALTAMGLDVDQLSRVNDVFVGTITRSNTNMEMMAESFKYAAPMARAYGYSIEELSGLIGMLGNAGIQGCYDTETDVLTGRGWVSWPEVRIDDEFATRNPKTGEIEYQKAKRLIRYHHTGKMFLIQNRGIDLCVTPDHRMWVKRRGHSDFEILTAKEVDGKNVAYEAGGLTWKGNDTSTYTLPAFKQPRGSWTKKVPALQVDTKLWATFLGWYISEGCCDYRCGSYRIRISQNPGAIRDRMRRVFNKSPWTVHEDKNGFSITNEQLYREVVGLGKAGEKHIPAYAKVWSPRLLGLLFVALIEGDGDENDAYYTSSRQLADDVSEVVLKLGWAAHVVLTAPAGRLGSFDKEGREIRSRYDQWKVNVRKKQLQPRFYPYEYKGIHGDRLDGSKFPCHATWIDYDDDVFCAEVPNHLLIVRRNGKSIVSGNSMAGTQLARAMMKAKEIAKKFGFESGDLVDVLESLRAKGYTASQAIEMFGGRAGKAAGVLFEATGDAKAFQEQLGKVGGEAESLANVMRDTLGGSFKELKSTVESLKLDVFEVFRDDLKGFTEDITQFIRENKSEIVGFAEVIKESFTAVLKVMSFVQESMGTFVKNFAQTDFYKAVNWVADIFTPVAEAESEVWFATQAQIDAAIEKLREMKVATEDVAEATKQIHQAKDVAGVATGAVPVFGLPTPVALSEDFGDYLEIVAEFHRQQEVSNMLSQGTIQKQYDVYGEWLESWAGRVAGVMNSSFETFFFDAMTGQIQSLGNYLTSFLDDISRQISSKLAGKVTDWLMGGPTGGGILNFIPGLQHGGLVTSPTLAMVGEVGPEVVVPLNKFEDEGFWSRLSSRMGGGGSDSEPMNVTVNISTPNPQAFRESKSQVAAQMAVALTAAGRNL